MQLASLKSARMHNINRQCYRSYVRNIKMSSSRHCPRKTQGSRKDSVYLATQLLYAMPSSDFPIPSKITHLHDQGGNEGNEP
jgi:hypothetical protein